MTKPLLWAMLALWAACGARHTEPELALRSYGEELQQGDFEAAYSFMSEEFRAKHTMKDFVRMMKENSQEVSETTTRLRSSPERVEVSAEVTYGVGDRFGLVVEGGEWKISNNPIAYYDQTTPREALRSFLRAYHLKRWDVLLRFVPTDLQTRMTVATVKEQFAGAKAEEVAELMSRVGANIDSPISEPRGNQARMAYGDRYEVEFLREDGLWKIQDLD